MLTFSFVKQSRQAASYYEATDDYYAKEGHRGEWDGEGAKALGLEGGVERETFKDLLEGKLPDGRVIRKPVPKTGKDGKKVNARLGIDFTFSAPKSVSIVALVSGDRRVIAAHDEAVKDALKLLESKVVARKKVKRISFREHTNKLVVAKFQHDLSRDQDPQLHTHAVTMNLTQREDGRWTALANEEMLKSVKMVGAYYRAQLAQRLEDMGYELRATRDGFEMASVPDEAIKLFSQRSRSIEMQLDAQGLTRDTASSGVKQTITKNTRKKKDEGDRAALRKEWRDALAAAGIQIPEAAPEHHVAPSRVPPDRGQANASDNSAPGTQASTADRGDLGVSEVAPHPTTPKSPIGVSDPNRPENVYDSSPGGPATPVHPRLPSAELEGEASPPQQALDKPAGKSDMEGATLASDPSSVVQPTLEAGRVHQVDSGAALPTSMTPAGESIAQAPVPLAAVDSETREKRAKDALAFAIEHLAERQGIFTRGELLERAYLKALGSTAEIDRELERAKADGRLLPELPLYQTAKSFSREEQAKAIDKQFEKFRHDNELQKLTRASWISMLVNVEGYSQARAEKTVHDAISSGRLVETEERFTTPQMRNRELHILWMERLGRNTVAPIKAPEEVDAMLANTDLNPGQRDAAKLVLTTTNRYVGIQGYAGVGKSHMLSKAVDAIKAETAKRAAEGGYNVIGLAPYGSQNKALKELGMESQTLAWFLAKPPAPGSLGPNTIIFLDEASVVPAHQMQDLMQRVEQYGARLVFLGDRKQTQAVEAGKPFEQLQDAGMQMAHITAIQRQKDATLKAAVEKAANDNVAGSVLLLKERTKEIADASQRHEAIANDYTSLDAVERNNTLIVVGTNEARREVNSMVRERLGLPAGEKVRALESYDMTRAEHRHASSYKPGLVLIAERDGSHRLKRGEHYEVLAVDARDNKLILSGRESGLRTVDASDLVGVSSYQPTEIELVQGDWLRLTRNDNKQKIFNGERYQVAAVEPDAIVLSNGARLSRADAIHAQHGYAQTVHSAQGLTTNRVLMDADTRSLTSNRAVYYVAISRGKHNLTIYTDHQGRLAQAMSREPRKYAALELRDTRREADVLRAALAVRRQEKDAKLARQTLGKELASVTQRSRQATRRRSRSL